MENDAPGSFVATERFPGRPPWLFTQSMILLFFLTLFVNTVAFPDVSVTNPHRLLFIICVVNKLFSLYNSFPFSSRSKNGGSSSIFSFLVTSDQQVKFLLTMCGFLYKRCKSGHFDRRRCVYNANYRHTGKFVAYATLKENL